MPEVLENAILICVGSLRRNIQAGAGIQP